MLELNINQILNIRYGSKGQQSLVNIINIIKITVNKN